MKKKQSGAFMIVTRKNVSYNTGSQITLDGGEHRITHIQSVELLNGGMKIKGWCKPIENKNQGSNPNEGSNQ
ncbi:hypothetical protein [Paenibacillus cymbidii]|uniref:hypothetical protein n=1 Tax=Paenibacillus cymbidii TaxID=1639034 RepID=UPI001080855E|nr:hypothetical protein [Paenibacillus cymbidii]